MLAVADSAETERERVRALVLRFGWNATAFQTLESGYRYFFQGDAACVAYVDTGSAWVAAGAPIAAPDAILDVALSFMRAARASGKRCSFFATEARFEQAGPAQLRAVRIGEQPIWDPHDWPDIIAQRKSLREQLRRARAKGLRIRQLSESELETDATRAAIEHVIARWYRTRAMAPMKFLVQVEPFTYVHQRRCFVAEVNSQIVGFASVIPVPARGGWFIENLVRDPRAPNGTPESLVDAVMRWAAKTECRWLTLGIAPLAGDVAGWLQVVRRSTRFIYDFDGVRTFKAKLRPREWSPIYLSLPHEQSALLSIVDVLSAFTRGGFLRFGLQTLLRGSTSVLRIMTALLIPWTLLLALAPVRPWFGESWAKWGWVGFDMLVFAGLCRVLRRPTPGLFRTLWLAVSADAVVTLLQTVLWNLHEPQSPAAVGVFAIACAAPAFAAWMLRASALAHLRTR